VAGGLATLKRVYAAPDFFDRLTERTARLARGLEEAASAHGHALRVQHVDSMGCAYFAGHPVHDFADAERADAAKFYRFHGGMLERGAYLAPSPFEAFFLSSAHGDAEIEAALSAARDVLAGL